MHTATQHNAQAPRWTTQNEKFHWLRVYLGRCNFLNRSNMVDKAQSKFTLRLDNGNLVIKVDWEARVTLTFENGTVSHSTGPDYVPSTEIEYRVRHFLRHLDRLGLG